MAADGAGQPSGAETTVSERLEQKARTKGECAFDMLSYLLLLQNQLWSKEKEKEFHDESQEQWVRLVDAQQQLDEQRKLVEGYEHYVSGLTEIIIVGDDKIDKLEGRLQRIREHLEKLKEGMESTHTDLSGLQVVNELLAVVQEEGDTK